VLRVFVQSWRQLDRCPDVPGFREWIMNLTVGTCLQVNYRHLAKSTAGIERPRRLCVEPAGPGPREFHVDCAGLTATGAQWPGEKNLDSTARRLVVLSLCLCGPVHAPSRL
jgi:hypothetical protein